MCILTLYCMKVITPIWNSWQKYLGKYLGLKFIHTNLFFFQLFHGYQFSTVQLRYIRTKIYAYYASAQYAYTRMHIRKYAYTVYACMPHWYVWANLLFLLLLTVHCFLPQSKREFSLFWIRVYSIRAYVFRLDLAKC